MSSISPLTWQSFLCLLSHILCKKIGGGVEWDLEKRNILMHFEIPIFELRPPVNV